MSTKFTGSWELQKLPLAEQFFAYSDAYLEGAETITRELIAADKADDFLRGSTAIYLARHAVELFLKGALLQANSKVPSGHSLETLARQFETSFPEPKYTWSIPFRTQVSGHKSATVHSDRDLQAPSGFILRKLFRMRSRHACVLLMPSRREERSGATEFQPRERSPKQCCAPSSDSRE